MKTDPPIRRVQDSILVDAKRIKSNTDLIRCENCGFRIDIGATYICKLKCKRVLSKDSCDSWRQRD